MPLKALADLCSGIIVYRVMTTVPPSTVRVRKLRERRSKGVALVAPVEVGEGGIDLLVSKGLLDQAEWVEYHDNGKLWWKGTYRNGKRRVSGSFITKTDGYGVGTRPTPLEHSIEPSRSATRSGGADRTCSREPGVTTYAPSYALGRSDQKRRACRCPTGSMSKAREQQW